MEKEALIDIILNDIKDLQSLIGTFKGKKAINKAFINLSHTKLKNIGEEINLLESFDASNNNEEIQNESSLSSVASPSITTNDSNDIANSSLRFVSGETASEEKTHQEQPKKEIVAEKKLKTISEESNSTKKEVPTISSDTPSKQIKKTEAPLDKSSVLGEKIKKESTSVNEHIADKKDNTKMVSQYGKPVSDVRKAIGLNDRFYFQRELFNGNAEAFNNTLDQINQIDSYELALQFVKSNYNWDEDNEVAESFYKSIKRRFI